tara:strand:- start:5186 stop:5701 length:516 start_codon:yes stop_codon:yes gene_type:complete
MPRPTSGTDVYIYKLLDNIVPFFCKNNIHPNIITLCNLLFTLFLYNNLKYCNKKKNIIIFQITLYIIIDCLDGEVARQCNKQSTLGGYLDIICDLIFYSVIIIYLISKYMIKNFNYFKPNYIIYCFILNIFIVNYISDLETHVFNNNFKYLEILTKNCILVNIFISYLVTK